MLSVLVVLSDLRRVNFVYVCLCNKNGFRIKAKEPETELESLLL